MFVPPLLYSQPPKRLAALTSCGARAPQQAAGDGLGTAPALQPMGPAPIVLRRASRLGRPPARRLPGSFPPRRVTRGAPASRIGLPMQGEGSCRRQNAGRPQRPEDGPGAPRPSSPAAGGGQQRAHAPLRAAALSSAAPPPPVPRPLPVAPPVRPLTPTRWCPAVSR